MDRHFNDRSSGSARTQLSTHPQIGSPVHVRRGNPGILPESGASSGGPGVEERTGVYIKIRQKTGRTERQTKQEKHQQKKTKTNYERTKLHSTLGALESQETFGGSYRLLSKQE